MLTRSCMDWRRRCGMQQNKARCKVGKEPKQKVEKFLTALRCKLTDDEYMDRSAEMADGQSEITTLEETIAGIKKEYAAKIDSRQARVNELVGVIRARSETRIVECRRIFDYDAKTVYEFRDDTNEQFSSRRMRDDEMQGELEFDSEGDK